MKPNIVINVCVEVVSNFSNAPPFYLQAESDIDFSLYQQQR